MLRFPFPALFAFALLCAPALRGAAEFAGHVEPLVEKHCAKCHNTDKQKGGVNLTAFKDNIGVIKDRKLWQRVIEQIESGDMPPDDEPVLLQDEEVHLLADVKDILENFDFNDPRFRDPGPSLLRRLTQTEYQNCVRDLFGIEFDAGHDAGIAQEDNGTSYENLAVNLSLSPALLEKYFTAADKILERVFLTPPERQSVIKKGNREGQIARNDEKAATAFLKILATPLGKERETARTFLTSFMHKAYRREPSPDECDHVLALYEAALARNEGHEKALQRALKPVLVSPYFLFRWEADRATPGAADAYRVSDSELAARLSFFLWSTLPDDELVSLADAGKLSSEPGALETEVRRMLASPKADALTDHFLAHWLRLEQLRDARPQQDVYPLFNNNMRDAMRREMLTFVTKLREEDRAITELLQCDYLYANSDLAKLYGLPFEGMTAREFKRVSLPPDSPRGGLLGMGGVLAMTSHTNRTSPTLRGKYILDVVLGDSPPPPPANVGQLKAAKTGEPPKTVREQLAQHATQANCAACHKKIDPLGFALDNFDGIGVWRNSTPEVPLDTQGTLPSGEKFNGVRELKKVLVSKQDQFVRNLVEQTFVYALGRELNYYDQGPVHQVVHDLKQNGFKFSTLILGVVRSYPFQYRKNAEPARPETARVGSARR